MYSYSLLKTNYWQAILIHVRFFSEFKNFRTFKSARIQNSVMNY